MKKEVFVISVGGSLIVPNEINSIWLKKFKVVIEKHIKKDKKFVIICGGGKIARKYANTAKEISKLNQEDLDWLGIHCTRLNAHLLRTIFKKNSNPAIVKNPTKKINFNKKIIIAAGWKPGCSTDYDAVLLAKKLKINKIINLTNIDYVYDKNPKKYKNAKPLKETNWKKFRKLIPKKWSPGLNSPFDPIAAKECEKSNIEVTILNGEKLANFNNFLEGKNFIGSVIR
jgi:uridylate kinase